MQEKKRWIIIETIIIILAIIVFFSIPILATKSGKLEDGDHFASTLAPILSLISSILVYIAFKAQIKANEKIQLQFDIQNFDQNFFRLIDNIEKRINNSEIEHFNGEQKIKGYAILEYIVGEVNKKNTYHSSLFGKNILLTNPSCLNDNIWEKIYNEIDGNKFKNWKEVKKKFLESDENERELIINDITKYEEYDDEFFKIKIEIFNTYFYDQSLDFFNKYYNYSFKKLFSSYIVFFDSYYRSIKMIMKHIDSIENVEFYKNYLNDNLTTYEKLIIWMAISSGKFGVESKQRILKFEILSTLNNVQGIKAVRNPNYYEHIKKILNA